MAWCNVMSHLRLNIIIRIGYMHLEWHAIYKVGDVFKYTMLFYFDAAF